VVFTLLYGALMAVDIYLLRKYAKAGVTDINLHGALGRRRQRVGGAR